LARGVGGARAAIVASGSELVRGDRSDRNGPYLAADLLRRGVDPARITVVGDDPGDLEAALRDGLTHDLLVVSGGLGPTHDDRTIELLARAAGVGLRVGIARHGEHIERCGDVAHLIAGDEAEAVVAEAAEFHRESPANGIRRTGYLAGAASTVLQAGGRSASVIGLRGLNFVTGFRTLSENQKSSALPQPSSSGTGG
jgi:molybdenum cofactor synthesis domain-containing protein